MISRLAMSMSILTSTHSHGNALASPKENGVTATKPVSSPKREKMASSEEPLKTPVLKANVNTAPVPVNIRPFGLGGTSAIEAQFRESVVQVPTENDAPPPEIPQPSHQHSHAEDGSKSPVAAPVAKPAPKRADTVAAITAAVQQASKTKVEFKTSVGLSDLEKAEIEALKERDREVRAHENAHKRAGGAYAGHPTLTFVRGPNNQQYAVAGEVSIDTKEVPGDPKATIEKMRIIKNAALAPQRPSSQDRQVAAKAEALIRAAQAELNNISLEKQENKGIDVDSQLQRAEAEREEAQNNPSKQEENSIGPTPNKDDFQPKGISISI